MTSRPPAGAASFPGPLNEGRGRRPGRAIGKRKGDLEALRNLEKGSRGAGRLPRFPTRGGPGNTAVRRTAQAGRAEQRGSGTEAGSVSLLWRERPDPLVMNRGRGGGGAWKGERVETAEGAVTTGDTF